MILATDIALTRSLMLERLADDLRRYDESDPDGGDRMAAVFEALSIGRAAQLDTEGLRTLWRLRMPQELMPRRAFVSSR